MGLPSKPPPALGAVAAILGAALTLSVPATAFERVRPELIRVLPHDPEAFTQGLLYYCGRFFESTGLYGESTLREVDPTSGNVLRSLALPEREFGEGLARVGEQLIQLTWREGIARRYQIDDFAVRGAHEYAGQGWGLCYDGRRLVMTDGSSELYFRDPESFELMGSRTVRRDGVPVEQLNELECVGDLVYANVWMTDEILRINPDDGEVLTEIDASGLLTESEAARADVLNGIAYDDLSGSFFITGKRWPRVFEVRFPFAAGAPGDAPGGSGLDPTHPGSTSCSLGEPLHVEAGSAPRAAASAPLVAPASRGCLCAASGTQPPWVGGWTGGLLVALAWRRARRRSRYGYGTASHCTTSSGTSRQR